MHKNYANERHNTLPHVCNTYLRAENIQIQFNASVPPKINDGVHELHEWYNNKRN